MFMDLFDVNKLPPCTYTDGKEEEVDANEELEECEYKEQFDTAQYDAYETKDEKLDAIDAGHLLLRTDDDVDFQEAWSVLREMIADESYKQEVLNSILQQSMPSKV